MTSQFAGPPSLPIQVQPSAWIISLEVAGSSSSQTDPIDAGRLGLLSSQSSARQKPSPSLSVHGIIPTQEQPSS